MSKTIHLGYEVGSGTPVEIPIRNMAVTGQTQESGKTTTLEALAERATEHGARVLAFVTKRGESAFRDSLGVKPYFRDRADWQFVDQLLEAQLREKNKFLRPWIIKICRETQTLADVQREVRKALKKAKYVSEGVYTQLDAYLELIVPEIERADLAPSLTLARGTPNVMDVSSYAAPMQMLFVQSAIDWVNANERDTIVIVPEAWEFIPEGKGSPVKASAVSLVRKGSGIGNHIWVDSQDMAGVDKVILRGCPVWLIGVQREANEIKRNLANIPAGIARPTAAQIATLARGQFYACHGSHAVKAYVQPTWMSNRAAEQIARGEAPLPAPRQRTVTPNDIEADVKESEARALRDENERLKADVRELSARIRQLTENAPSSNGKAAVDAPRSGHSQREMPEAPTPAGAAAFTLEPSLDNERLYQAFKQRLLSEPAVLKVIAQKPELRVEITRPTIETDADSIQGRLARLIADGFFDTSVSGGQVTRQLARSAYSARPGTLWPALDKLALLGFLVIEDGKDDRGRPRKEYRAVDGMKVNIVELADA